MNTQYLVTVKDGRIGKSRQIKPFKIEYIGRSGNLDELAETAERSLVRFAGTKRVTVAIQLPPNTETIYADVYCDRSETPIGRVKFDRIKEETE